VTVFWHPWAQAMGMKTDKTKTLSHASFRDELLVLGQLCQVNPIDNGGYYRIQCGKFTFSATWMSGVLVVDRDTQSSKTFFWQQTVVKGKSETDDHRNVVRLYDDFHESNNLCRTI